MRHFRQLLRSKKNVIMQIASPRRVVLTPMSSITPRAVVPTKWSPLLDVAPTVMAPTRHPLVVRACHEKAVFTLKQAGFLAIQRGDIHAALVALTHAYRLSHEPLLAMQLGYLYDGCADKPRAYRAFKLATRARDPVLALKAQRAMTQLRGDQLKAWPKPYFSQVFFTPFTQSRFGLTVTPLIVRSGFEQTNAYQTKEYVFIRRTDDNKSVNLGQISQIYEDDVQITGVGGQWRVLPTQPVIAFAEVGAAYDLIYRQRDRWRSDVRIGAMYYDEFGAPLSYVNTLTWGCAYYANGYADAVYFSRYNNNVIGGVRTQQGIRFLQYHSSVVNIYMTARALMDTNRLFYNNFAEIGPGIALIPSDRFPMEIRLESIRGVYLPAGATPNPYATSYSNTIVQLLYSVKL